MFYAMAVRVTRRGNEEDLVYVVIPKLIEHRMDSLDLESDPVKFTQFMNKSGLKYLLSKLGLSTLGSTEELRQRLISHTNGPIPEVRDNTKSTVAFDSCSDLFLSLMRFGVFQGHLDI